MSNVWSYGLFDCFSDITVCLITWVFPCYTTGKVAEGVGESCLAHGIYFYIPIVRTCCQASIRRKIRKQGAIEGNCVTDLMCHLCCSLCALVQEFREINKFQHIQQPLQQTAHPQPYSHMCTASPRPHIGE